MANGLFTEWFVPAAKSPSHANVTVLNEQKSVRASVLDSVRKNLLDHLVGLEVIASIGGFESAAKVIQNSLPTSKKTRSGDFGEILATEYAEQALKFIVPVRKLRYKDDREMPMRGDDTIGFRFADKPVTVLKAEAKSRIKLSKSVVSEAVTNLRKNSGRPNPSTLSFISRRLREWQKHEMAVAIEGLQENDIPFPTIKHLIFTLSGNDPSDFLKAESASFHAQIDRELAGCVIPDHADFIAAIFAAALSAPEAS